MAVTLTDVAQVAGVSIATASRVLSGSAHPVSAQTREHVLSVAEELGYHPNLIARSLRTERTFTIGIIFENISEFFSSVIARGILDYLKPLGYLGIIVSTDYSPDVAMEVTRTLINRSADGIIFVDTALHSLEAFSFERDIATVFVNRRYKEAEKRCIIPDNHAGARLAVEHLLELGHRRIAYIGGPKGWEASAERLGGYCEALEARGVRVKAHFLANGDWQLSSGYDAAQHFLTLTERPTAIFASSDRMALGAMYAIQDAGLCIPDDVAVVGYDDRPFSALVRPSITTVGLPGYEMGKKAARWLLATLEGNVPVQNSDLLPVCGHLIVRESCGAKDMQEYP